jgi:integrase
MSGESVGAALARWLSVHSLGRKPRSVEFNQEIHSVFVDNWPGALNGSASGVSPQLVTDFAARVSRFCPSRWNAFVGALKFVAPHAARDLRRRPLTAKERATVSTEDFARLLAELDRARRGHGGLVIRFLAQTGLRINEARQVEWRHVLADCICIPPSVTKNGRPRLVPFIAGTVTLLERLRIVTGQGILVLPQSACKTALLRACATVGLPPLAHHDFRHLFATRCIESGVDVPTVARWLGHSDGGALLAKRYFHLLDEHSRRMAAKVML